MKQSAHADIMKELNTPGFGDSQIKAKVNVIRQVVTFLFIHIYFITCYYK